MPALFFPNLSALRVALASRLVPPGVSRAPAAAGFDPHGRLWLVPAELPPREALAALARLGVQALGGAGVPTEPVRCWGEVLPLVPDPVPQAGAVLFLVPDRKLARFVARLKRLAPAEVGIGLRDDPPGVAWVTTRLAPPTILAEVAEPDSPVEAPPSRPPGCGCGSGGSTPSPTSSRRPRDTSCCCVRRASVAAVPADVPKPAEDEFRLPRSGGRATAAPPRPPVVPVRLTLGPRRQPVRETLWVFGPEAEAGFWAFCATADEQQVRRLEAAAVAFGTHTRLVVRAAGGKQTPPFPVAPGTGFAPDGRVERLFVPAGSVLRPTLRVRELTRALGVADWQIAWVEPGPGGGVVTHAVPVAAFRPLGELVAYAPPAAVALHPPARTDPFALPRFAPPPEPALPAEPEPPYERLPDESIELLPDEPAEPGWLRRKLGHLVAKLRTRRERAADRPPVEHEPAEEPAPEPRVGRALDSADALRHGPDSAWRRGELETRLFRDLPRLGPDGRAGRWADLAAAYATTGNAPDAAVCWMNAAWEAPAPPAAWFDHWLAAECRAAKLPPEPALDRWLSEPGRPGVGRVVAAFTARAGLGPIVPPEFPAALPRVLAFLDQHFDDLPLRAAWLARLAATRLCDGDALGLARWSDRVSARLLDRGPGLDLDEPSFLRFHGTASADRFHAARDWLVRVEDKVLRWVERHGRGRLLAAGLDAETEATAAYARMMVAWGLGCLGERARSRDGAARARKELARRPGPAAHALLGDLFLLRVRDAQEGHPPKAGLPPDLRARLDALPYFDRYAVDKLREHSRILEPADRVRAYRGTDLKTFWGTDRLGERLFVLAGNTDPAALADEAEDLLRLCSADPTPAVVPRVVFTLLEVAPRLDPVRHLPRTLGLLGPALDWAEAWLAGGPWPHGERARKLHDVQARMLDAAFHAAAALPADHAGPAVAALVRRVLAGGVAIRGPLLAAAGVVFRTLRRLELPGEAEAVAHFLDPDLGAPIAPEDVTADRVGLAAGWYVAGNEDAAARILDGAREALFNTLPQPTDLAIAYADALGFAPPGIAHGRLDEVFKRLTGVAVMGSTNRYFTLKPLQLIDTVVRAVVTDGTALGPAVRSWLADDEFLIRGRVRRDLTAVLREQGIG